MSTHNALCAGWTVALLSLAASGCSPTLQDGRFSCTTDTDCPEGFACRASDLLCYREAVDGGAPTDASSSPDAAVDGAIDDAGLDDGGVVDAAAGCGTNCIRLMVLNADLGATGSVEFNDRDGELVRVPIPPYGTTSTPIDVPNVPVGGTLIVNVPPTLTLFHELSIPREGRYLLVLGSSSLGTSVLLLEAPVAPLHTGGYVYVELIDMTLDETEGLLASGAGRTAAARMLRNPFEHGTISEPLPFLPGAPGGLQLELSVTPRPLIAALPADQISGSEGTYYVVIAGRVAQHLDTDEGLRFIPGLPGSTALRSSPLVRFLNTLGASATVCDGSTPLTTLLSGELSTPRAPPESAAWDLTVRVGGDCATGASHTVSVGTAVGRTLVSIGGDTDSLAAWQAVSIAEPIPVAAGLTTIVLHNTLSTPSEIAGSALIPSLDTGSVTEVTRPTTITATTAEGLRTFDWSPMARQSWAVIASEPPNYVAYEVDSPFEQAWTVTAATGR